MAKLFLVSMRHLNIGEKKKSQKFVKLYMASGGYGVEDKQKNQFDFILQFN